MSDKAAGGQGILTPGNLGGLPVLRAGDAEHKPCPLIYGRPGIGKTTLVCSAAEVPELSPVIYLGLEKGVLSVKDLYPDVCTVEIKNLTQLQGVFDDLLRQSGAGFRTVIVDNATEAQNMGFEHYFAKNKGTQKTDFTEFSPATWENGAYSWSTENMGKLARYFQLLPNVVTIFTAWANDFSDHKSSRADIRPAFTNKASMAVTGVFQDVYYYSMEKSGVRQIQTAHTPTCIAKDRTRKLPPYIENPSMKIIWEYWKGIRVYTPEEKKESDVAKPRRIGAKK